MAKTAMTSALLMSACATVAAAADLTGVWVTEEREALIRIASCGGGAICGTVAWLRDPIDPDTGRPKTDTKNPDPSRKSRPLIGVRIFYDMKPSGADQWAGKIYSTDDGVVVNGQLIAKGSDAMRIQGCVFGLCSGQNWTRERAAGRRGKSK
jgi:uncharacterized protein (DUF2147 family)